MFDRSRWLGFVFGVVALAAPELAAAKPGFGEQVDAYCSALGRGAPYASLAGHGFLSECSLCHQFTYPPQLPTGGNTFDPPAAEFLANRRSESFSWFCPGATNQLPVITPIADRNVNAGEMLVIDVLASDGDGDPLVLSVSNAPAGASFVDHGNGTASFSWTPRAGDLGSRTVNFLAQDDALPPGQAMEPVAIAVGSSNRPPVLGAIGPRALDPGVALEIAVAASDLDGDALQLSATPLPAGASFNDGGNGTGFFAWTPSAGQLGNHALTFLVRDAGVPQADDFEQVTLTVGSVNAPPTLAPIGNRNVTVGALLSIALSAQDADGDMLAFSALALPAGAQLSDAGDGAATLDWLPSAGDAGTHDVTVTVADDGTPPESDSESFRITVAGARAPSDVCIDDARWDSDKDHGRLRVRGSGAHPREMVGILDGRTGLVLGSKQANRHGAFRLAIEPMTPPCAVEAQAGEVRSEAISVRGAPVDCGEQVQVRVRARWQCAQDEDHADAGDARLRVGGERAPAGASVVVHDAARAAALGSTQADARGRFELRIDVATPPSALDVVIAAGGMEWGVDSVAVRIESCGEDEAEDDEAERRR